MNEPNGSPAVLEPYMGMRSHAAVLRGDGAVFVHLHPSGSINLTAQRRFAEAEGAGAGREPAADHAPAGAADGGRGGTAHAAPRPIGAVTFPFVFPEPGAYRIVVQVKIGAAVETAAFDVEVEAERPS